MSDQAGILSKWFSNGGTILAQGQLDHSYTFWTRPFLIFSQVYVLMRHPLVSCFSYQNFLTSKNDIFAHLLSSFSDQKSRWPTEFLKNGRKEVDSDGDLTYIFFFICHILTTCTFSKFMLISNNRTLKQIKKTL